MEKQGNQGQRSGLRPSVGFSLWILSLSAPVWAFLYYISIRLNGPCMGLSLYILFLISPVYSPCEH